ncbi:MAG: hypothetical protein P4L40_17560, partial [Terracidiphilus sp.]|nr:hypothetical protein [Terracidiphilus sp.]
TGYEPNAHVAEEAAVRAATVTVPQLRAGQYSAWRPQMENTLLRAGVAKRDYAEENADWAALATAVDNWSRDDERASIAFALGRKKDAKAPESASSASDRVSEEKARRGAIEAVARGRKAFALLYQALSEDLRKLVAAVPQGYAYGLWSWLETRYQSTEQDSIGDLWEEFTQLEQEEDESFDAFKARVDRTRLLLDNAKEAPSPGLYAHRLLRKLRPNYNAAVLALNASGRLKDAKNIKWDEIVAFINNHEKNERRLAEQSCGEELSRAMSAYKSGGRRGVTFDLAQQQQRRGAVECFRCGGKGHMARECKARFEDTRNRSEGESDDDGALAGSGTRQQRANVVYGNRFEPLTDDSEDEDWRGARACSAALSVSSGNHRGKTEVQAGPATAAQDRPGAVSVRKSRPGRAIGGAASSSGPGSTGVQLRASDKKTEEQAGPATAAQDRPGAVSVRKPRQGRAADGAAGSSSLGLAGVQRASTQTNSGVQRDDAGTAVRDQPGAVSTEHVSLAGRHKQQRPSSAGRANQA